MCWSLFLIKLQANCRLSFSNCMGLGLVKKIASNITVYKSNRNNINKATVRRSSRPEVFCITGKHLCQVSFFYNFIKKDSLAQVFSFEFCAKFLRTPFYRTRPVVASVSDDGDFEVFSIVLSTHHSSF